MDPLVSVLIPTYNTEHYVGRALQSAVEQSYRELEIIVQDNSSTDKTWDIVMSYAENDSRIRSYRNSTNLGPLRNWQTGLERCRGEYVKILWSDDWLEARCIEECVAYLRKDNDVGLVFTGTIVHGLDSDFPVYLYPDHETFSVETYLIRTIRLNNMPVSPGCALVRRADAKFELLTGSSAELKSVGARLGAGPDVLFLLMAAIRYKKVAHVRRLYSHFQTRPECFTISHAEMVQSAYEETLRLFLRDVAEPQFSGITRTVQIARLLTRARSMYDLGKDRIGIRRIWKRLGMK
jgi:glycosyltransferase involved in cell wall biosynthesis